MSIRIILDRNKWKKSKIAQFGHKTVFASPSMLVHTRLCVRIPQVRVRMLKHVCMCFLWTTMRTHAKCTCTQTPGMRMHRWNLNVFIALFDLPRIKTHPKLVPTFLKASGFHLNPSHSKTQALTSLKMDWNWRSKQNLKMRKVWKTYQSKPCIVQEMFHWSVEQWRGLVQPYGTNPVSQVEDVNSNHVGGLLGLGSHWRRRENFEEDGFQIYEGMKE